MARSSRGQPMTPSCGLPNQCLKLTAPVVWGRTCGCERESSAPQLSRFSLGGTSGAP